MTFAELNLDDQLLEALSYMGFENATPIQEKAIPLIIEGKDLIASAQTGTGKTGAFVMPILHKLAGRTESYTNTLIIVPTRELAIQVEQQIQGLSYFVSVSSKAVYGGGSGKDWDEQKAALKDGTDIIVATPGKLLSHLKTGYVKFDRIEHLILDEADRMLDMGFVYDIMSIISYLPKERQTLLFSATMPKGIVTLAGNILKNPERISLSIAKPAEGVTQLTYLAFDNQKVDILKHILNERKEYESIIIFSSSKSRIGEIVGSLKREGFKAHGISSNLSQDKREDVLRGFRSKRIRILVGTDVISRGIDIKDINLVINYDVPNDAADYVHRVGRTARANTKGEAFTLISPKDMYKFKQIEDLIEAEIEKLQPPEAIGKGPEWNTAKKKPFKKKRNNNKKKFFNKKSKS